MTVSWERLGHNYLSWPFNSLRNSGTLFISGFDPQFSPTLPRELMRAFSYAMQKALWVSQLAFNCYPLPIAIYFCRTRRVLINSYSIPNSYCFLQTASKPHTGSFLFTSSPSPFTANEIFIMWPAPVHQGLLVYHLLAWWNSHCQLGSEWNSLKS